MIITTATASAVTTCFYFYRHRHHHHNFTSFPSGVFNVRSGRQWSFVLWWFVEVMEAKSHWLRYETLTINRSSGPRKTQINLINW